MERNRFDEDEATEENRDRRILRDMVEKAMKCSEWGSSRVLGWLCSDADQRCALFGFLLLLH